MLTFIVLALIVVAFVGLFFVAIRIMPGRQLGEDAADAIYKRVIDRISQPPPASGGDDPPRPPAA